MEHQIERLEDATERSDCNPGRSLGVWETPCPRFAWKAIQNHAVIRRDGVHCLYFSTVNPPPSTL